MQGICSSPVSIGELTKGVRIEMFLLTLVERSTCRCLSQLLTCHLWYEPDRLQSRWTRDERWHRRTYNKILNTCVQSYITQRGKVEREDLPWLKSASPVKPSRADIVLGGWKCSWYVLRENMKLFWSEPATIEATLRVTPPSRSWLGLAGT